MLSVCVIEVPIVFVHVKPHPDTLNVGDEKYAPPVATTNTWSLGRDVVAARVTLVAPLGKPHDVLAPAPSKTGDAAKADAENSSAKKNARITIVRAPK
jgi:hypothetical protein